MTRTRPQPSERDLKVAQNVRDHGCFVYSVFADSDGSTPSFSYSIGLQESAGVPDAIVLGVPPGLGKSMVDAYQEFVLAGIRFEPGQLYPDFIGGGFRVYVEPVPNAAVSDYMLGCFRYYGDRPFSVVQIVYPSIQGVWPWEAGASAAFVKSQPMLGRPRLDGG